MGKGPKKYKKQLNQKKHPKSSLGKSQSTNTYIPGLPTPIQAREMGLDAKRLEHQYQHSIELPKWLKEVEIEIRKQSKLQSIKIFAQHSKLGLQFAKEAVEIYIATGEWDHVRTELSGNTERLDMFEYTFQEVFNTESFDEWRENETLQHNRFQWLKNHQESRENRDMKYLPYFTIQELRLFSEKVSLYRAHKKGEDIWEWLAGYFNLER